MEPDRIEQQPSSDRASGTIHGGRKFTCRGRRSNASPAGSGGGSGGRLLEQVQLRRGPHRLQGPEKRFSCDSEQLAHYEDGGSPSAKLR
jgi:hypothetical protein